MILIQQQLEIKQQFYQIEIIADRIEIEKIIYH